MRATGPFDIGQAVVVAGNHVLALEAAEGTDQMLERIVELKKSGRIRTGEGVGVLVKAPKPTQDRRFDLAVDRPAHDRRRCSARALPGLRCSPAARLSPSRERIVEVADRSGHFRRWIRRRCDMKVFLVAGEESGDRLGAALMRSLKATHGDAIEFAGVGGYEMAAEGLAVAVPDR